MTIRALELFCGIGGFVGSRAHARIIDLLGDRGYEVREVLREFPEFAKGK